MEKEAKNMECLSKISKSTGLAFKDESKDNLRQRSTKQNETNGDDITPSDMMHELYERSEEFVHKVWDKVPCWSVVHHSMLPQWLQDNEYLHNWHRPHLPSFAECFKSVFKLHSETGNIWTHLVGCIAFIYVMIYFLSVSPIVFEEKFIFSTFFLGAILCLGFSTLLHTLGCHSESSCKLFGKLDYCGISLLITGSCVPWFYYVFYCDYISKIVYISMIVILGTLTMVFSLYDKFGTSEYRTMRALSFVIFGMSAAIPAVHYMSIMDWNDQVNTTAMQSVFLLAFLYVLGAGIYAARIPERLFPGKCDLWFQSHQIFHVLVVAGAFVTYYGLKELAVHRNEYTECGVVNIPLTSG
ncbi:unnamed protein product, partial [Meganyctiphanes norvegica]|uniref:Adiponectin receptor protein n=1 Tax=Meganyctiphanes norvegica TaxID=48144 RepID=A0AAV2Q2F7_MEGNR